MKAVKITKYREPVVIRDVPKPEPGPNDALVKVEACGICRSDWHSWHGDFSWIGLSPELPITQVMNSEVLSRNLVQMFNHLK